ncbi:hypothetical protein BX600DRAFT_66193 [Xylariales sp. PMI_506]|nr:hypothetical protein BX600DRAFT_66193 [Xylariales sp. PMI_506]
MSDVKVQDHRVQFQFIVATPRQPQSRDQQRHIRSHAARKLARRQPQESLRPWIGEAADEIPLRRAEQVQLLLKPKPTGFGSVLSWVQFPEEMAPYMLHDVLRFFTTVQHEIYPEDICLKHGWPNPNWFGATIQNPLYLHTILFATEAWSDHKLHRSHSRATLSHFSKALALLRATIGAADPSEATSDEAILTVIILALIAEVVNDQVTMRNHMHGLQKMVTLRGGFRTLRGCVIDLAGKACRADLGLALRSGTPPLFFRENISWDSHFEHIEPFNGDTYSASKVLDQTFAKGLDWRLLNVWKDLQRFSETCNLVYQTGYKLMPEEFCDIITSILYRLLHLSFEPSSIEDVLRISMSVFGASIFYGHANFGQAFPRLREGFHDALGLLRNSYIAAAPPSILFWLLMTWHVSFSAAEDDVSYNSWLDETIRAIAVLSWAQARLLLKSLMWVDFVHDAPAAIILNDALARIHHHDTASRISI